MAKIQLQTLMVFFVTVLFFSGKRSDVANFSVETNPSFAEPCGINYNDWELNFQDEFNGSVEDLTENWYLFGDNHGAEELQIYKWDQLSISEGNLVITAQALSRPEVASNGISYNYASGWIYYKKMVKGNSLFEIKCKMPEGREQTLWPAFWMWNGDCSEKTDGYREIDIFEYWGDNYKCGTNNVFWCDESKNRQSCIAEYCEKRSDYFNDFHVFSLAWLENKLVFFIDGKEIRTITDHVPSVSDEMYLIANLALGNSPSISEVKFPQYFTIDWIRIYDLKTPENTLETCTRVERCEHTSASNPILQKVRNELK